MYTLDLTNCYTAYEMIIAIEADLNARKQLSERTKSVKKSWFRRIFGR